MKGLSVLLLAIPLVAFADDFASATRNNARELLSNAYRRAIQLASEERYEESAGIFADIVKVVPSVEQAWMDYGSVLEMAGMEDRVDEVYTQADSILASPTSKMRLCETRLKMYMKAPKGPETDSVASNDRAFSNAYEPCRVSAVLNPNSLDAQFYMGFLLKSHHKYHEALPFLWNTYNLTLAGLSLQKTSVDQLISFLIETFWGSGDCFHALSLLRSNSNTIDSCFAAHIVGHCTKHSPEASNFLKSCMCGTQNPTCATSTLSQLATCPSKYYQVATGWQGSLPRNVVMKTVVSGGEGYGRNRPYSEIEGFPMPLQYLEKESYIIEISDAFIGGESGVVFDRCFFYSGGHEANARVNELPEALSQKIVELPLVSVALMFSQTHNNYYHFVAEALGRLMLLREFLLYTPDGESVVVAVPGHNRFVSEIVTLFGLTDRIIVVEKNYTLHVPKLYIADWQRLSPPPPQFPIDETVKDHYLYDPWAAYQPSRAALKLVQREMWGCIDRLHPLDPKEPPLIILVSRGDVSSRNIIGEEKLLSTMRSELPSYHVVSFLGTSQGILEQARTFRRAKLVVSGHGASLANLIFCTPRTQVLLFPLEPNVDQNFGHIVSAMELDLWLLPITAAFHQNFTLTADSLLVTMNTIHKALAHQKEHTHDEL
ncbi:DUF563 domain-containing protein [Pelomyxa schiedti]|nr:DUF563 domain-containing protein [Pelomyxa schiedti]